MRERRPGSNTVYLAGRAVNLTAIARAQGIDLSHLSRIFSGQRICTVQQARKLAGAFGMTIDEFLDNLDTQIEEREHKAEKAIREHRQRVEREQSEDMKRAALGLPAIPRMPGMRVA